MYFLFYFFSNKIVLCFDKKRDFFLIHVINPKHVLCISENVTSYDNHSLHSEYCTIHHCFVWQNGLINLSETSNLEFFKLQSVLIRYLIVNS